MSVECKFGVMPVCKPKECGVEFCDLRDAEGVKKLKEVPGGWASYALSILANSQAKKERSKTKKQRKEEAKRLEE